MDITLVETIGAADANSYISLEDAETYFYLRAPTAPNWLAVTDENIKKRALITATRLLDTMVDWEGDIIDESQALCWPRQELYDSHGIALEADELPDELRWAVCEFAEVLLVTDKTADLPTQGIQSLQVGAINIAFSEGSPPTRDVLPDAVWDLVSRWGSRRDSAHGSATIVRA